MNAPTASSKLWNWLGAMGIVFAILFVVANVLLGGTPGVKADPAKIVEYYNSHKATVMAGVFVVVFAALAFGFFLTALRRSLAGTKDESAHLFVATMVGGAIYLGGLLLMDAINVSLIDAAHNRQPGAALTLNFLENDGWVPVVVGLSIVALSTGISALRGNALPRWLAWASVVLGVLAVAGPLGGIAFLIAPIWTLAVGIVIIRRPSNAETIQAEPAGRRTVSAPGQ